MPCPRLACRLLARADRAGRQEALVGDLLEEIAQGRSRRWVWRQVLGVCWFALVAHLRPHARVTPHVIALALGLVLLGGASISSLGRVLETWTGFYLLAGTLSLFADVMSRTLVSRTLVIAADSPGVECL